MPQNISDADAFTSPVVAPLDGEDADAASIIRGLQPLADRTRYLYNLSGGLLAANHVWTGANQFNGATILGPGVELAYDLGRLRTIVIPLASGVPYPHDQASFTALESSDSEKWLAVGNVTIMVPVVLPAGSIFNGWRALVNAGVAPNVITVNWLMTVVDWTATPPTISTTPGPFPQSTTIPNWQKLSASGGGLGGFLMAGNERMSFEFDCAVAGQQIAQLEVDFYETRASGHF